MEGAGDPWDVEGLVKVTQLSGFRAGGSAGWSFIAEPSVAPGAA